jgi:serine protease inhibitor
MLPPDGNQVYSPYSISLAFAMTYAGARGDTASQMADVLHYTLPDADLHPAYNALDLDLAARPDQVQVEDEADRFELSIANALFGQQDWTFLPEFLDLLATNYGADMRLVDFENAPESARRIINDWVSDQTHKHIQDIIPPGSPDPTTRLAIANAIYFKATWQNEFDHDETTDAPFYLLDGTTASVDMMGMEHAATLAYGSGDGWQAVALPYKGGLEEMVVIVPDSSNFEAFDASLTPELYDSILASLVPTVVYLHMPKFTFDVDYALSDSLIQMGMTDAFELFVADFSGMDGSHLLYIGDALHKAFIAVDEKGTEAAAATIILMMGAAMPPPGITLTIDRPFFFVIRDVPTGTILFMGRVLDPR